MDSVVFYTSGAIGLLAAFAMLIFRNPLYSALSLVVVMISLAGHFVLLNAGFLAAVQLIVYAGAIMVLVLFVIFLLSVNQEKENTRSVVRWFVTASFLITVLVVSARYFLADQVIHYFPQIPADFGSTNQIGRVMFADHLLIFELSGVVLLMSLVTSVTVAKIAGKS